MVRSPEAYLGTEMLIKLGYSVVEEHLTSIREALGSVFYLNTRKHKGKRGE